MCPFLLLLYLLFMIILSVAVFIKSFGYRGGREFDDTAFFWMLAFSVHSSVVTIPYQVISSYCRPRYLCFC